MKTQLLLDIVAKPVSVYILIPLNTQTNDAIFYFMKF